jgi:hypothetical protein
MYENRWTYFVLTLIFNGIVGTSLLVAWMVRESMSGMVRWYIWVGLSGLFLVLGLITLLHYLLLIIRGN